MRCFALVGAFLLALLAQASAPAQAQMCREWDAHGRCLVCSWWFGDFTLHPGEVAQPFSCGNMARDPQARLVIGGLATYLGSDGSPDALDHRIALRVGGHRAWARRSWGPNTARMPVGPTTIPLGPVADGGLVVPNIQLAACYSRIGGPAACHFALSGRICLTNMC